MKRHFLKSLIFTIALMQWHFTGLAQIQMKIKFLPSEEAWGIYAKPIYGTEPSVNTITASGQVTIVIPTGYQFGDFITVNGSWSPNARVNSPVENPEKDYYSVGFNNDFPQIKYFEGEETLLFKIEKVQSCPDTLYLIAGDDPFAQLPNSLNVNPGNELSVFDYGKSAHYDYMGNYGFEEWSCVLRSALQLSSSILDVDCEGNSNGSITVAPRGGVPPYIYKWSTNATTATLDNLSVGNYSVTVNDNGGNSTSASYRIKSQYSHCVWPGDGNYDGMVGLYDLLYIGLNYGKTNLARPNSGTDWHGHVANSWSVSTPGSLIDAKHSDTDGDGVVNKTDMETIELNWGKFRPGFPVEEVRPNLPVASLPSGLLPLKLPDHNEYYEGDSVELPLSLGTNAIAGIDIHGVAFTLSYDKNVIEPGSIYFRLKNSSWMAPDTSTLLCISKTAEEKGKLKVVFSLTEKNGVNGFGEIGWIGFKIKDEVVTSGGGHYHSFLSVDDVLIINSMEEEIRVSINSVELDIFDADLTSTFNPTLDPEVSVFPNPASDYIHIESKEEKITKIILTSLEDKIRSLFYPESNLSSISTDTLPRGIYALQIYCGDKFITKKLVLQ